MIDRAKIFETRMVSSCLKLAGKKLIQMGIIFYQNARTNKAKILIGLQIQHFLLYFCLLQLNKV